MEHNGWLVGVPEEHLVQDVEDDGQDEEATESDSDLRRQPELRKLLHQRTRDDRGILKKTHCKKRPRGRKRGHETWGEEPRIAKRRKAAFRRTTTIVC